MLEKTTIKHERMRICADDGNRDQRIEVTNPYTNAVIGTMSKKHSKLPLIISQNCRAQSARKSFKKPQT